MASFKAAAALLQGVLVGNPRRVKAALEAGANVHREYPELPCTVLVAAKAWDGVKMAKFLMEKEADPDRPTDCGSSNCRATMPGARALHIAAQRGNVEIVLLLLERAGADPNATDQKGNNPLMMACTAQHNCVAAVVGLLLVAGADPALTEENGFTAMHLLADHGEHLDLVDVLHTGAPATLNSYSNNGRTPLSIMACAKGHESMVSRLLSQGAMQPTPLDGRLMCPLAGAAIHGNVGVTRILINKGKEAVGGMQAWPLALYSALACRQTKILQLLLLAGGGEAPIGRANSLINEKSLLHHAAGYCSPAAVSVLLAVGADEANLDSEGRVPRDAIGVDLDQEMLPMDREKEVAIRRMLEQGPAYRARSWAWPTEEADGGGCGDGGAVLSSAPATPRAPPVVGVRIFRPNNGGRKFFVSLIGRYCQKY